MSTFSRFPFSSVTIRRKGQKVTDKKRTFENDKKRIITADNSENGCKIWVQSFSFFAFKICGRGGVNPQAKVVWCQQTLPKKTKKLKIQISKTENSEKSMHIRACVYAWSMKIGRNTSYTPRNSVYFRSDGVLMSFWSVYPPRSWNEARGPEMCVFW